MRRGGDGGQALPLVILAVVAAALGALVLAQLGGRAQLMAQAQTAADAAALAGATAGPGAAQELAAANGATLESYGTATGAVRVEVALAGERAVAAASLRRVAVSPALAAALDRARDLLGHQAVDAVRVLGRFGSGGIEVPRHVASRLAVLSHRTGLCRAADGRPLHFDLCPASHRE